MNELKPCPFCGRKMKFYKSEYINKYGNKVVEQYYMHEESEDNTPCILDEICMPFVIGAGDAKPEEGYIGEYAELWNRRADVNFVRCLNCKYLKADTLDQKAVYFCTQNLFAKRRIKLDDFCSYGERKDG